MLQCSDQVLDPKGKPVSMSVPSKAYNPREVQAAAPRWRKKPALRGQPDCGRTRTRYGDTRCFSPVAER